MSLDYILNPAPENEESTAREQVTVGSRSGKRNNSSSTNQSGSYNHKPYKRIHLDSDHGPSTTFTGIGGPLPFYDMNSGLPSLPRTNHYCSPSGDGRLSSLLNKNSDVSGYSPRMPDAGRPMLPILPHHGEELEREDSQETKCYKSPTSACPHCGKQIVTRNMTKHVSTHDRECSARVKHCQWCSFQTSVSSEYPKHIMSAHNRCPYCRRVSTIYGSNSLRVHMMTCPKKDCS